MVGLLVLPENGQKLGSVNIKRTASWWTLRGCEGNLDTKDATGDCLQGTQGPSLKNGVKTEMTTVHLQSSQRTPGTPALSIMGVLRTWSLLAACHHHCHRHRRGCLLCFFFLTRANHSEEPSGIHHVLGMEESEYIHCVYCKRWLSQWRISTCLNFPFLRFRLFHLNILFHTCTRYFIFVFSNASEFLKMPIFLQKQFSRIKGKNKGTGFNDVGKSLGA